MKGIMTLTKTPCELDTMSLFQDLKLKRRKVDSRCSSDGESVADTSTSSPDMTGPGSPCKLDVARSSPSPGIQRDRTASPDSVLPELTPKCEDRERTVKEEEEQCGDGGSGGEVKVKVKEEVNVSVFDGGGAGGGGGGVGIGIGIGVGTSQSGGSSSNSNSGGVSSGGVLRRETVVTSSPAAMIPSPPTFWVSSATSPVIAACRINGVMPELIGGGVNYNTDTMKPPMSSPQRPASSGVRTTPTVIMGEAGGVRTMIWSQPSAEQPSQQIASTSTSCWSPSSSQSSTLSSGPGNSEETAAHLLLNLGQEQALRTHQAAFPVPLNMEKLWAGDLSQLPATQLPASQMQAINLSPTAPPPSSCWSPLLKNNGELQTKLPAAAAAPTHHQDDGDEEEQPMICMICEDKATGLHYGIITCEGCKGFFKRTVQNRRVYTCVADGVCEITKAQRNRCQYCRFKKCIEQGMVLQAVREDRMPGGRNSGAVYNLYKVKYKKHKKSPRNGQVKAQMEKQAKMTMSSEHGIPPHLVNGTILKTALTNPSEVVHLRQRLDNAVSSSRDRALPIDATLSMIQSLIDCDEFQDIATLQNLDDLLEHKTDLSDKLMQIGDSIVYKLVQWTKRLPFYLELPVEVHTRLLTHKWHELLVLTTSAYQAIHGANKLGSTSSDGTEADFTQEVSNNLCTLQTCLTSMMGRPITMDQLRQDVGLMVEKITHVTLMFRRIKLRMEEYVCLKVIIMLNPTRGGTSELETIQERYMTCLKTFVEHTAPTQPNRFHELLVRLPEVQSAASLLLDSKMFYVPFLLNSAIQR